MSRLWIAFALGCAAPDPDPMPDAVDTGPVADTDWVCAPDDEVCDGRCRAVQHDPQACGDCDTVCGDAEVCDAGQCVPQPVAPTCEADAVAALLAPATAEVPSHRLDCSVTLSPDDVVTKTVQLVGPASSGVTLDCAGATLRRGVPEGGSDTVVIGSDKPADGVWERATDVTVRGCRIEGSLRVQGQGANGQAPDVTTDSHSEGHRERAQAAAPTRVRLEGLTVIGAGRIPVYLAPGATRVTLRDSRLEGRSVSTALYLDAESAHNHVVDNVFDVSIEANLLKREVIAVDGSADNVFVGNELHDTRGGGLFLYRNCGEDGAVRHQEPRRNVVVGNRIVHDEPADWPSVWVGSRNGVSVYRVFCAVDDGYPFGSSLDDDDYARNSVIVGNRITGEALEPAVQLDDGPTVADDNGADGAPAEWCAVFRDAAAPRLVAEGTRVGDRVCARGELVP
jgi:hypothetical protein